MGGLLVASSAAILLSGCRAVEAPCNLWGQDRVYSGEHKLMLRRMATFRCVFRAFPRDSLAFGLNWSSFEGLGGGAALCSGSQDDLISARIVVGSFPGGAGSGGA